MRTVARHSLKLLLGVVLLISMTGCISPVLSVNPSSVTLSAAKPQAQIVIANDGARTLNWTAESSVPWLTLESGEEGGRSDSVEGSTRDTAILVIHLEMDLLPEVQEQLRAAINIDSNGGSQEIMVAVSFDAQRNPVLAVQPNVLDFADAEREMLLEIVNEGGSLLQWQILLPPDVDWITVSQTSGTAERGYAEAVTVRVNRARLPLSADPYQATLEVESNGGDATVEVTALATAFTASEQSIDFDDIVEAQTQMVLLETESEVATELSIVRSGGDGWLTVADEATITRRTPYELAVTADPSGRAPGEYTASIQITHEDSGRTITIPVTMTVGTPTNFRIDPAEIDFGEIADEARMQATIINEDDQPVAWSISRPTGARWLELSDEAGTLDDSVTIEVIVNPVNLSPGVYSANLTVYAGNASRILRVSLTRPVDEIPDALQVEPRTIAFGASRLTEDVTLWNEGDGLVDWDIDDATFPQWLQVTPLAGTVGGETVQIVRVAVDRELVPDDEDIFVYTIGINSSVDNDPVEVRVTVTPQRFPGIQIIGDGVDNNDVPYVSVNYDRDRATFVIRNNGNAELNWEIPPEGQPSWISSIAPRSGQIKPGGQQQVTVSINRSGLGHESVYTTLQVRSNDPETPTARLDVSVLMPVTMSIVTIAGGSNPSVLNYGLYDSTQALYVANLGTPNSELRFLIRSNHPDWIHIEPSTRPGDPPMSLGRLPADEDLYWERLDWRRFTVSIDRGRAFEGARAVLTIEAVNLPSNALPVEPVEVPITFTIPELTLDSGLTRTWPPSILRFVMVPRDRAQRTFPAFQDDPARERMLRPLNNIRGEIYEDGVPLEMTETNVFVKKEIIRCSVMIMLDYSASMADAAYKLTLGDDPALDPGGRSPLDALYIQTVGEMLKEFPDDYAVGIAVFNERRFRPGVSSLRAVTGAPDPAHPQAQNVLVRDKAILEYRIENTDVVDYGATPLYCAILDAAAELVASDRMLPDYDGNAERILVALTDGRVTTPPEERPITHPYPEDCSTDVVEEALLDNYVRFYPIGFGIDVSPAALIDFSQETGGFFYNTRTQVIDGSFDAFDDPITVPRLDDLLDICTSGSENPDARSLPEDLQSHVVLRYVTLNEQDSMSVRLDAVVEEVDPPVRTSRTYDATDDVDTMDPPFIIAGDVRLGQIAMRTNGIQDDGAATVRVYVDYAPRNIGELQFQITSDLPIDNVTQVSEAHGGITPATGWDLEVGAGGVITLTSRDRPLYYGDWGNLVDIAFVNAVAPFDVGFTMLYPVFDPEDYLSGDGKFFAYPRGSAERPGVMEVGYESGANLWFPHPAFEFTPQVDNQIVNADADSEVGLTLWALCGEHLRNYFIEWEIEYTGDALPGTTLVQPPFNFTGVNANVIPPLGWIAWPRIGVGAFEAPGVAAPGTYSAEFYIVVRHVRDVFLYPPRHARAYDPQIQLRYGPYYLQYEVN